MGHLLLSEWANWTPSDPPCVFPGDLAAMEELNDLDDGKRPCVYRSWEEYSRCPRLGRADDCRLHLGLLPHPFCGDPSSARIVILLLNPGFGPHDAFAEFTQPDYCDALLQNLRGESVRRGGFLHLDPHFAWTGAFRWWHGKLCSIIEQLCRRWDVPYPEARDRLRAQLAAIELVPYHSPSYSIPRRIVKKMESVKLARDFVHQVLVPRAERGECLVLVTRKAAEWGLEESRNVIVYRGSEAQAAHLTAKSRGGKRILAFLSAK